MPRKVLVADDEESVRALIVAVLDSTRLYDVIVAENGDQALALARARRPDLVLLDVRMPMRDGYDVCRKLKGAQDTCHIKVVMLTALAQEHDRTAAIQAGADAYLAKPFALSTLLDKVGEVLKS